MLIKNSSLKRLSPAKNYRKGRDLCRSLIGPEVTFIILNPDKTCQMKRLAGREGAVGGTEMFDKIFELYEPGGDDEDGAVNVTITEDMSTDDVLNLVLEAIAKN